MALKTTVKNTEIGVGDRIKVTQKIKEKDKERNQIFDGMVIKIKGAGENKSFTVRRIGVQQVGIERIYPVNSPSIVKVEVVREGTRGVRRSKLYYTRDKSKREIEQIYTREKRKREQKLQKNTKSKAKNKTNSKSNQKSKKESKVKGKSKSSK